MINTYLATQLSRSMYVSNVEDDTSYTCDCSMEGTFWQNSRSERIVPLALLIVIKNRLC